MKPTPARQLADWVEGRARCPNTAGECCPDFSCCRPHLMWSKEDRVRFMRAGRKERSAMLGRALGALVEDVRRKGGPRVHVIGRRR